MGHVVTDHMPRCCACDFQEKLQFLMTEYVVGFVFTVKQEILYTIETVPHVCLPVPVTKGKESLPRRSVHMANG